MFKLTVNFISNCSEDLKYFSFTVRYKDYLTPCLKALSAIKKECKIHKGEKIYFIQDNSLSKHDTLYGRIATKSKQDGYNLHEFIRINLDL